MDRPTMRDVAALANVSPKTVSRVINGEKYVSNLNVERVQEAMKRLNYRHNLAASQLRSGATSAAIGLILVDIANPFSSQIHRTVQDVLQGSGIAVLSASTDEDAAREREAVAAFTARRVGGLILMPASHDHSYLATEVAAGTRIVLVDRPPAFLNVDAVVSDNVSGARTAVDHLLSYGHRRIAFMGDWPHVVSSQMRYEGYLASLSEAGLEADPNLIIRGFESTTAGEESATALMMSAEPPTAIFVAHNAICAPVVRALQKLGRQHQVAVVGFDGWEDADLIEPGLTVITQDVTLMARTAAEKMLARLNGVDDPAEVVTLGTQLVQRGSGEIRPE